MINKLSRKRILVLAALADISVVVIITFLFLV